jgi:hypothetical protein
MHLLARTVSGLRVELVVRDHSENFCIQGSSFAVNTIFALTRLLVVQAAGQSLELMRLRTI